MLIATLTLLRRHLRPVVVKWQTLVRVAGNPYRPELHYMRGPGPKWHAKQVSAKATRTRPNPPR
ncbi:hypothetical protein [Bradyrhizobium sp.]|uniref:hypothetical protein n=1 Tax=Bradyrhizobium sp. TaxID=376 RepID=UPI002387AEC2|nr:hypothetical protein [Bradyrhizobium sp.]MDE2376363.1 hypothetical protein [Bradyrhizobium sp.]